MVPPLVERITRETESPSEIEEVFASRCFLLFLNLATLRDEWDGLVVLDSVYYKYSEEVGYNGVTTELL